MADRREEPLNPRFYREVESILDYVLAADDLPSRPPNKPTDHLSNCSIYMTAMCDCLFALGG